MIFGSAAGRDKGGRSKNLLMIPARVALALQADGAADWRAVVMLERIRNDILNDYDGKPLPDKVINVLDRLDKEYREAKGTSWYLRSEIIWHKPNPMPESVRDRPTKAHEMIYLLAKQPRYFYDAEAVAEAASYPNDNRGARGDARRGTGMNSMSGTTGTTRNRRDVWTVTTKPYREAHFAVFPPDLIEPCILAGTSAKGECPKCGRAWVRVVERHEGDNLKWKQADGATEKHAGRIEQGLSSNKSGFNKGSKADYYENAPRNITTGWRPSCACVDESDHSGPFEPVPQTVLDPFNGSGTTGAVAVMHGRNYVGIELNPAYVELSMKRINGIQVELT